MRADAFRDWLDAHYHPRGAGSRASEAARVERAYGDLDKHFAGDRLATVLEDLRYGTADEALGNPNPSRIEINGNVRNGLASLSTAVRCYRRFADGTV